jgi:hypothetical protein
MPLPPKTFSVIGSKKVAATVRFAIQQAALHNA